MPSTLSGAGLSQGTTAWRDVTFDSDDYVRDAYDARRATITAGHASDNNTLRIRNFTLGAGPFDQTGGLTYSFDGTLPDNSTEIIDPQGYGPGVYAPKSARLKSFCYYTHDHMFSTSASAYQLEHRREGSTIDDIGGGTESTSDRKDRDKEPYDHDVHDHSFPTMGYFHYPNNNNAGNHSDGGWHADANQIMADYGITTNGAVWYIYPGGAADESGGTSGPWSGAHVFIPNSGGTLPENAALGLVAHEWSHTHGAVDVYDLDFYWNAGRKWPPHKQSIAMDSHSVMGMGSCLRMDPFNKIIMGWITPKTITTDRPTAVLPQIEGEYEDPSIFLIPVPDTGGFEFFLLENHNANPFGNVPRGLYIYHVDLRYSQNGENFFAVIPEQADGEYELELLTHGTPSDLDGDVFPGNENNRAFTQFTEPSSRSHGFVNASGQPILGTQFDSYLRIDQISDPGNPMTFRLYVEPREVIPTGADLTAGYGGSADQGTEDVPILQLNFENRSGVSPPGVDDPDGAGGEIPGRSVGDVFIDQLRVDESGSSKSDADTAWVKLYEDTNGNKVFDPPVGGVPVDQLLQRTKFSGQTATFSGLAYRVPLGSANGRTLFICYDIATNAQTNPLVSLGAELKDVSYVRPLVPGSVQEIQRLEAANPPGAVPGFGVQRFPIGSLLLTVTEAPDTLFVNAINRAPANVEQGAQNVPFLTLDLTVNRNSVQLATLRVDESGTSTRDADTTGVHLYHDLNKDGVVDPGDVLLRNGLITGQHVTFTNLNLTVAYPNHEHLLLTYDVADDATLEPPSTLAVQLVDNTYITLNPPASGPPDMVSPSGMPIESGHALIVPTAGNTPPTLTASSVNPPWGPDGTVFTLGVTYTDADNDPPSKMDVTVIGPNSETGPDTKTFAMVPVDNTDTDYTDGARYILIWDESLMNPPYAGLPRQWYMVFETNDGKRPSPAEDTRLPATAPDTLIGPRIQSAPPASPTLLTVWDRDPDQGYFIEGQFRASAADPGGVDHYRIIVSEVSPVDESDPTARVITVPANGDPFPKMYSFDDDFTGPRTPANGTTLYYIVQAVDGVGNRSIASNEASAQVVDNIAPQPPSSFDVVDPGLTPYQLDLSWGHSPNDQFDPGPPWPGGEWRDVVEYRLRRVQGGTVDYTDPIFQTFPIPPETTSFSDTTAVQGVLYTYGLTAFDGTQESSPILIGSPPTDLILEVLTVAPDPSLLGSQLTATVTVRNAGALDVGPFWLGLWVDRATEPTAPDGTGDRRWLLGGLTAGASITRTYNFTPGASGTYTAWALADDQDDIPESNETNNALSTTYTVQAPDLVIDSLTVTPDPSGLGTEVDLTVTVLNQGDADAGVFCVDVWEHRTTPPPLPTANGDRRWTISGLAAGNTVTRTYSFTPAAIGTYTAWALADSRDPRPWDTQIGDINEADESNNALSVDYTVELPMPDLIISQLTVAPDTSSLGTELTFTVTVKNVGNTAADSFRFYLWWHRDTEPTAPAVGDDGWYGTGAGDQFDVNEERTVTSLYTPPAAGSFTAWALADGDAVIDESDEDNNTNSFAYTVTGPPPAPDLVIDGLWVSPDPSALGTELTADVTVRNAGTAAAGAFRLDLWRNRASQPTAPATGDQQWAVAGLGVGATGSYSYNFTPATDGSYTAWALADSQNAVAEADETNNAGSEHYVVNPAGMALAHSFAAGLALVGVPATPLEPTTADSLFGTLQMAWYDGEQYLMPWMSGFPACERGFAAWMRFDQPREVEVLCERPEGEAHWNLHAGWNLIGCPAQTEVPWSPAAMTTSPPGAVANVAWAYDPATGYVAVSADPLLPGARQNLVPWQGHWVYAAQPCTLAITVPPSGTEIATTAQRSPAEGQVFRLTARSASGAASAYLGVAPRAISLAAPPPPGGAGPSVTVSASDGPRLVDVRAKGPSTLHWKIAVQSAPSDGAVHLAWPDLSALPREYRPLLSDLANGRKVSMRSAQGYTFTPAEGQSVRMFSVDLARSRATLAVTAAAAAPSRAGASISFGLSTQATIAIQVLNIAGRVVATVDPGTPTQAGPVTRAWSGRSDTGTRVPAGRYLVRITARTPDGQQTSAVTSLVLPR